MKKKILSIALVVALAAIAAMGTLAYFTDTDQEKNTFVAGGVAIDLHEANKEEPPAIDEAYHEWLEDQVLMPGSSTVTAIAKRVYVENTGKSDAYVRVHIAIPSILDNGNPDFDASSNLLHFNNDPTETGNGKWSWGTQPGAPAEEYFAPGDTWNYYETTIGNISYNVYVVTYETALEPGEVTPDAIHQFYLHKTATNADIARANAVLGEQWNIYVFAEGGQVVPFANAFEALNEQFGVPGDYTPPFNP